MILAAVIPALCLKTYAVTLNSTMLGDADHTLAWRVLVSVVMQSPVLPSHLWISATDEHRHMQHVNTP